MPGERLTLRVKNQRKKRAAGGARTAYSRGGLGRRAGQKLPHERNRRGISGGRRSWLHCADENKSLDLILAGWDAAISRSWLALGPRQEVSISAALPTRRRLVRVARCRSAEALVGGAPERRRNKKLAPSAAYSLTIPDRPRSSWALHRCGGRTTLRGKRRVVPDAEPDGGAAAHAFASEEGGEAPSSLGWPQTGIPPACAHRPTLFAAGLVVGGALFMLAGSRTRGRGSGSNADGRRQAAGWRFFLFFLHFPFPYPLLLPTPSTTFTFPPSFSLHSHLNCTLRQANFSYPFPPFYRPLSPLPFFSVPPIPFYSQFSFVFSFIEAASRMALFSFFLPHGHLVMPSTIPRWEDRCSG